MHNYPFCNIINGGWKRLWLRVPSDQKQHLWVALWTQPIPDDSSWIGACLAQFLLLLQIATHVFQLLQFILFTLFHNAVIHDWMVSRVPTCKGAQNKEQELLQGFLTELVGLIQTVLFQGSKQVRTEHTRRDNSIAS